MTMRVLILISLLFLNACATNPSQHANSVGVQSSMTLYQQALKDYRSGRTMAALEAATQALKVDTKNWRAHELLGLINERLGRTLTADEHFQKAFAIQPHDPSLLNNYGTLLCRRKNYSAAEENFRLAAEIEQNPHPEIALINAGLCANRATQREIAKQYFLQALEIAPDNIRALYQLAKLSLDAGNPMAANDYLQQYLQYAAHTPKTLLLGAKIEQAMGNRAGVKSYMTRLQNGFPDSAEYIAARNLLSLPKPSASAPPQPVSTTGVQNEQWLATRNPDDYTLQIASAKNREELLALAQLVAHLPTCIYSIKTQGNPQFQLIVGDFPSVPDANRALKSLPIKLQSKGPWVRRYADLQRALAG